MKKNSIEMLFLSVLLIFLSQDVIAMESKVFAENEVAKMRATFELGELYALGEDGKPEHEEARKYFEEVIKADIDKELLAWSYLWLSKISLDEDYKEEAQEYLEKAGRYGNGLPFVCRLVELLKGYCGGKLDRGKFRDIFRDAARKGSKRTLEFLLADGGVDVSDDLLNAAGSGYIPLFSAIEFDCFEICKMLIKKGSNVNAQSIGGSTPLHLAALTNRKNIVKLLIENGAEIDAKNIDGTTPLFLAAQFGYFEMSKMLVERGADVNVQDEKDNTPLILAAKRSCLKVCKLLIENGAEIDAKNNDGYTPLLMASMPQSGFDGSWLPKKNHIELCTLLIEKGADVNAKSESEWAPLFCAVLGGYIDICKLLIENGADVNARDDVDNTPLLRAVEYGHLGVCKFLIENGADLNVQDMGGWTPILLAARMGHVEICKFLIESAER